MLAELYVNLATVEWFNGLRREMAESHMAMAAEIGQAVLWPGDHAFRDRCVYFLAFVVERKCYAKQYRDAEAWYLRAYHCDVERGIRADQPTEDRVLLNYGPVFGQFHNNNVADARQSCERLLALIRARSAKHQATGESLVYELDACSLLTEIYDPQKEPEAKVAAAVRALAIAEELARRNPQDARFPAWVSISKPA